MQIILRLFSILLFLPQASAFTLSSESDWQLKLAGFVELGLTHDSKPSFLESAGSFPIVGPDTPDGSDARTQISLRRSRLGISLFNPKQDTWKPKGFLEIDFAGNRESFSVSGLNDTEITDPSLRIRHLYLSTEYRNLNVLVGQTWSLFGWQPTYRLATVSAAPGPGVLSQRTKQLTFVQSWENHEFNRWQAGLSFEQASQKAGGSPNLNFGARYAYKNRRSGFTTASSEVKVEPLSLALSATLRKFATGSTLSTDKNFEKASGEGFAINTMIPVLAATSDSSKGTLTWTVEYSRGTGYGGSFSGWSGNLPQFPYSSQPPSQQNTYLGKGFGGYDSDGSFHLFRLQSWSSQLQYHWPLEVTLVTTLGASELSASNVAGLGPVPGGFTAYDQVTMQFINFMHDFKPHIRGAIEYARFTTEYVDQSKLTSDRYQANLFYRF